MSADWPEFQLGTRCIVKSSKRIFAHEYVENGIPFFRSKDVIDKSLGDFSGFEFFISRERYEQIKLTHGTPQAGDLLISSVGNRSGISYIVQDEGDFYFKDGNIIWLSEFKNVNPHFLSYWFKSDIGQERLTSVMIGSAQKALTIDAIRKLWIRLPEKKYQDNSVSILLSLDRKIKTNRQINQTLESIAQAIFKSWFVDFEPVKAKKAAKERWYAMQPTSESASPVCYADEAALPDLETYTNLAAMCAISGKNETELTQLQQQNPDQYQQLAETAALFPSAMVGSELGEIPEGWEVREIGNEVEIVGGGTPSTSEPAFWDDGEIRWTTPKDLSNNKSKVLLDTERRITEAGLAKISSGLLPINTVLMSSRAPVGYLALAKTPVAINQGYIAMKCASDLTAEFVILWAESVMDEIQQRASGTTFAEISKKTFRAIPMVKPAQEVVNQFTLRAGVIFDQIESNEIQTRTLVGIRDGLLPRLLSGEIDLTNIQSEME